MVTRTTAPEGESLDDVQADAAAIDSPPGGMPPGDGLGPAMDAPPPRPTNAQMLKVAIEFGRDAFCGFTTLTSPRATLADEQIGQLGDVWGAVLDKHQIDLNSYIGDYAVEFAALVVTVSIGSTVYKAAQAEIAHREGQAKAKAEKPVPETVDADE